MPEKLLSMSDAAKICPYEKGYLSLLARRGELQAEKIGRNWYTKVEWLNAYLKEKKPNEVIKKHASNISNAQVKSETLNKKEKSFFRIVFVWMISTAIVLLVGIFVFSAFSQKISSIEKAAANSKFIPEQIEKIPNDQGTYDVYSVGKIKVGVEQAN